MTKTESAYRTIQAVVIEAAEQLLDCSMSAGARLAIPGTEALIMVGPADWIAKNVPGVEAMVEGAQSKLTDEQIKQVACDAVASRRLSWLGFDKDEHGFYTVPSLSKSDYDFARAIELEVITRLAVTTQASTAQAEANAWISVDERLPDPETDVLIIRLGQIRVGAIFIEYESWEEGGRDIHYWDDSRDDGQGWDWTEVTHWMPLPASPVIRSAGDTGSGRG